MIQAKFLLTTGEVTSKVEEYVIDLFRLYLTLQPRDIPHRPDLGFDFNLDGVFKDQLEDEVTSRVDSLISLIQSRIPKNGVTIAKESLVLIDESRAELVLKVGDVRSEPININFYNEEEY